MAEDEEFGPAMSALNERQRLFVMAMIEYPGITQGRAAKLAGYSTSSDGLLRKTGHFLAHNAAVQEAIREEAGKRLNAASLTAASVLMAFLTDKKVEPKDRIKAAGMLLDRSGFGAMQTIHVNKTVTKKIDASAAEARIAEFRHKFPEMFAKLVGNGPAPAVVDAEFTEVGAGHVDGGSGAK